MSAKHPEVIPDPMSSLEHAKTTLAQSGCDTTLHTAARQQLVVTALDQGSTPSSFPFASQVKQWWQTVRPFTQSINLTADTDHLPSRLKTMESVLHRGRWWPQQEVCNRCNEKRCYFRRCRFLHVCSGCAGSHLVLDFPYNQGAGPVRQLPYHPPPSHHHPPNQRGQQARRIRVLCDCATYNCYCVAVKPNNNNNSNNNKTRTQNKQNKHVNM